MTTIPHEPLLPASGTPADPSYGPAGRRRRSVGAGLSKVLRGTRGAESGWPAESLLRSRPNIAMLCLLLWGFVIHSGKLNIGYIALAAGLVATVLMPQGPFLFPRPLMWLAAYAGWALLTAPLSRWQDQAMTSAYEFIKIWLIAFLTVNAIRTRAQLRFFTIAWLALFGLFPVRGTLVSWLIGGYGGYAGRHGWNFIFSNPNDLAALSLMPIALCVGLLQVERVFWVRVCAIAGVAATALVVALTQSRGGLLALGVFVAVTVLRQPKKGKTIAMLAAAGLVVVLMAPKSSFDRVLSLTAVTGGVEQVTAADGSALQRYNIWKVARHIFAENPVTGVGIGTYEFAHGVYWREVPNLEGNPSGNRDAHSTFFRVLAELGLPGILLLGAMIGSCWQMVRQAAPRLKTAFPGMDGFVVALVSGQLAYLTNCVFGSYAHLPFLYLYVMLTVVAVQLYRAPRGAAAPTPQPLRADVPQAAPVPQRLPGRRGGLAFGFDGQPPVGR
jgi:O-antigen ligase